MSRRLVELIKANYSNPAKQNFDIDITEDKPTPEQLKTLEGFTKDLSSRPLLVDWFHGRTANDEQQAKTILEQLVESKGE